MNTLDIILLICFIPAVVQGFQKGIIAQIVSIVSIIFGAWLSCKSASSLSLWLAPYIHSSDQLLKIISFIIIFIAVFLVLRLAGKFIEGVFKVVMLGWLNSLLGAVFSLLKTGLLIGLLIMLFCSINNTFNLVSEDILNESILFTKIKEMAYLIFPYLKEMIFWNK